MLASTYIRHKFLRISMGVVSGATYWSYCKAELHAVLLVMKMKLRCSSHSNKFQQAG